MRKLLLNETFCGNKLDETIWNICEYNRMANNEQQAYMRKNVQVVDNKLIITSLHENQMDREYTSGKITTRGKFTFCKGRVEVVAKLPTAVGSWPAIWMMPDDMTGGWPACGEIDIMEHVGHKLNEGFFSIHTKDFNHVKGTHLTRTINIPNLTNGFHTFAFDWNDNSLVWYVDDVEYFRVHKDQLKNEENWPFYKKYHLIINTAIGGSFCEGKLNKEELPCEFIIKSIKVYSEEL